MNSPQEATPEWSFVCLSYGHFDLVQKLVESIQTHMPPQETWELFIVDNNSPGNQGKKLEALYKDTPGITVMALPENIGFGRGNDAAIPKTRGKYLVIINPDVELLPGTIPPLKEALAHYGNAIVVPQLCNPDGSPQANVRNFPTLTGIILHRIFRLERFSEEYMTPRKGNPEKNTVAVEWAQGSFLAMHRTFYDRLGGFDPRFFVFFEDMDLCRRAWGRGDGVRQVLGCTARHGEKRLSGGSFFRVIGKKVFWMHVNSALKYFFKYIGKRTPRVKP